MKNINQNAYGYQENRLWRCPECETINSGDPCYVCGYPRPIEKAGRVCFCGYQNRKNDNRCARCGHNLKKEHINWKKLLPAVALVAAVIVLISAVFSGKTEPHAHSWKEATCTEPRTCKTCGETTGLVAEHKWKEATCTTPKTCKTCGKTTGSMANHQWEEATYETPQTCRVCGKTTGIAKEQPEKQTLNINVNDVVGFGHYEQDGDRSNGAETIKWIVLDKKDNKYLLLSLYGLATMPFNEGGGEVVWEHSSIRSWLNRNFLNTAFTEEEQKVILTARVNNSAAHGNSNWNPPDEDYTNDKVYLLSCAELEMYFTYREDRICTPTNYAIRREDSVKTFGDGTKAGFWWLRSPGDRSKCAAYVNFEGLCYSNDTGNDYLSIRPALWIDLGS